MPMEAFDKMMCFFSSYPCFFWGWIHHHLEIRETTSLLGSFFLLEAIYFKKTCSHEWFLPVGWRAGRLFWSFFVWDLGNFQQKSSVEILEVFFDAFFYGFTKFAGSLVYLSIHAIQKTDYRWPVTKLAGYQGARGTGCCVWWSHVTPKKGMKVLWQGTPAKMTLVQVDEIFTYGQ